MIVRKAEPKDLESLMPIYREFLKAIDMIMTDEQILTSLMLCSSNKGLLMFATDNNIPIAISGGVYNEDVFMGEIAYVKPAYRKKSYKIVNAMIRTIKKTAKYWDVICPLERFKLWQKLGFDLHRMWLRRAL